MPRKPARAEPLVDRVVDHGPQGAVAQLQLDAVQLQGLAIFLHQRVGRRGEHLVQLARGQLAELHLHGRRPSSSASIPYSTSSLTRSLLPP